VGGIPVGKGFGLFLFKSKWPLAVFASRSAGIEIPPLLFLANNSTGARQCRLFLFLIVLAELCAVVVVVKASHPLSASNKMEAVGILLHDMKLVDALLYIFGKGN